MWRLGTNDAGAYLLGSSRCCVRGERELCGKWMEQEDYGAVRWEGTKGGVIVRGACECG